MSSSHLGLCRPLLLLPPTPPSIRVFSNESALPEVAKVLELQLQHHSFQRNPRADLKNGLVGPPCSPRDSQESSPTPQFKSINFLVLSFLHSRTLISIHDHWKTIALARWTFVGKVMSLLFNMLSRLVITSSREQASSNFMAAGTICSDFGAQKKKKVSHCFPLFPHLLPMKRWDWMP